MIPTTIPAADPSASRTPALRPEHCGIRTSAWIRMVAVWLAFMGCSLALSVEGTPARQGIYPNLFLEIGRTQAKVDAFAAVEA